MRRASEIERGQTRPFLRFPAATCLPAFYFPREFSVRLRIEIPYNWEIQ
jgi:hypothetical protein